MATMNGRVVIVSDNSYIFGVPILHIDYLFIYLKNKFIYLKNKFIYFILFYFWLCWVFIAACRLFSGCGEWRLLFIAVCRLFIVVASLVVEHRV